MSTATQPLDLLLHLVDLIARQPLHRLQKIRLHDDDGVGKDITLVAGVSIHFIERSTTATLVSKWVFWNFSWVRRVRPRSLLNISSK